jgi:hypothetical protein
LSSIGRKDSTAKAIAHSSSIGLSCKGIESTLLRVTRDSVSNKNLRYLGNTQRVYLTASCKLFVLNEI